MNSHRPGTETFLDQQLSVDEISGAATSCSVLVAGYSFHSKTCVLESRPDQGESPRAAILFADAVNAAPKADDTEGESRLGLIKCRGIFRNLVARFGGNFACYTGNFIIAEFHNVDTALQCAANVQLALGRQNARLQHKHQIRYRLGIEVGKTASAEDTQFNQTVDLVAELEQGVNPGGIYISRMARERLCRKSRARFVPPDKRHPSNASEPFEAFWIEMDRSMLVDASRVESDETATRFS